MAIFVSFFQRFIFCYKLAIIKLSIIKLLVPCNFCQTKNKVAVNKISLTGALDLNGSIGSLERQEFTIYPAEAASAPRYISKTESFRTQPEDTNLWTLERAVPIPAARRKAQTGEKEEPPSYDSFCKKYAMGEILNSESA